MLKTAAPPITVQDYLELPEGPPYYQLIEGDLYMAPSPDLFHQGILGNIYFVLRSHLTGHPAGTVHIAPSDVQLSELNVYQPDLYFVSNARKSILTRHGAEGAPDLIVEILSLKTARLDKGVKRDIYARAGVLEYWVVDVKSNVVWVHRSPGASGYADDASSVRSAGGVASAIRSRASRASRSP